MTMFKSCVSKFCFGDDWFKGKKVLTVNFASQMKATNLFSQKVRVGKTNNFRGLKTLISSLKDLFRTITATLFLFAILGKMLMSKWSSPTEDGPNTSAVSDTSLSRNSPDMFEDSQELMEVDTLPVRIIKASGNNSFY